MTLKHPRWEEFCTRLDGPEGFKEDENGNITWECSGQDRTFAVKILSTMPEIDTKASLEYFDNHGGHCDCEILFNIER